jgi:hypothetical protein
VCGSYMVIFVTNSISLKLLHSLIFPAVTFFYIAIYSLQQFVLCSDFHA